MQRVCHVPNVTYECSLLPHNLRNTVLVQLGVDTTAVNQARYLVYIMVKIGYLIYAGIY